MRTVASARRRRILAAEFERRVLRGLAPHAALAHVPVESLERAWNERAGRVRTVGYFAPTDDRHDPYMLAAPAAPILEHARRTCYLISASAIEFTADGSARLHHQLYGSYNALCPTEPFWSQPTVMERRGGTYAAFGYTGYALDPTLVLTCRHGWEQLSYERQYAVFDYAMRPEGGDPTLLPEGRVFPVVPYPAARPRAAAQAPDDGAAEDADEHHDHADFSPESDWLVLRLERPAAHLESMPAARLQGPRRGRAVYALGHPRGLPLKLSDGASVLEVGRGRFRTDLDTYVGSSGSPVFDARTHALTGVVSTAQAGQSDYEPLPDRRCYVSNRIDGLVTGQSSVTADAFEPAVTALLAQR